MDVCVVSRLGRFVLFCEEQSLFTIIISSGYGRSLAPVLEMFDRRREELARDLGLCGLAPFSFTRFRFSKRTNRHIIGSQNDLIYLLRAHRIERGERNLTFFSLCQICAGLNCDIAAVTKGIPHPRAAPK